LDVFEFLAWIILNHFPKQKNTHATHSLDAFDWCQLPGLDVFDSSISIVSQSAWFIFKRHDFPIGLDVFASSSPIVSPP
jgi:hypothetical protein